MQQRSFVITSMKEFGICKYSSRPLVSWWMFSITFWLTTSTLERGYSRPWWTNNIRWRVGENEKALMTACVPRIGFLGIVLIKQPLAEMEPPWWLRLWIWRRQNHRASVEQVTLLLVMAPPKFFGGKRRTHFLVAADDHFIVRFGALSRSDLPAYDTRIKLSCFLFKFKFKHIQYII